MLLNSPHCNIDLRFFKLPEDTEQRREESIYPEVSVLTIETDEQPPPPKKEAILFLIRVQPRQQRVAQKENNRQDNNRCNHKAPQREKEVGPKPYPLSEIIHQTYNYPACEESNQ